MRLLVLRRVVGFAFVLAASVLACNQAGDTGAGGADTLDPSADPDADYLTNAEEHVHGTDPQRADTDGDGYLDGDEVVEGSDPLDADSRIYQGHWPYQRRKSEIVDPGFASSPAVGAVIPRLYAIDQFGDEVDVYDFAFHGRPVVIDLSTLWCDACKDLAKWLAREPSYLDSRPELDPIREQVEQGEIYWITIVAEDGAGNAAGPDESRAWAEAFPTASVAVLADDDRALFRYLYPGAYPSLQVVEEDMTFRTYDRFDDEAALQSLLP